LAKLEVVSRLARLLDTDDFEAAAALIAPGCEYRARSETLVGRDAIVASYAASSRWAREHQIAVSYSSEIEPATGDEVPVLFIDDLVHLDRRHRYRCRQRFRVGDGGLVDRIVHEEIMGERAALEEFLRMGGIERGERPVDPAAPVR
jgi:hypothetical protein